MSLGSLIVLVAVALADDDLVTLLALAAVGLGGVGWLGWRWFRS